MVGAVLFGLVLLSVGYAFFSDTAKQSGAAQAGCIQVTPTLKIDGQTGDRMSTPLQNVATCIPSQYVQTDSITLTGTQYMDTGIPGSSALKIVADAQFASATANNSYLFGMRDCTTSSCTVNSILFGSVPNYSYYMNGFNSTATGADAARHTFAYANGSFLIDDLAVSQFTHEPSAAWLSTNNVYLGVYNNAGTPSGTGVKATIYDFKIYDGDTLVRHMVPVVDKQTGKCGMFDTVSNSFFGNLGTGDIVCTKPPVTDPNCDNLSCNGQNQGVVNSVVQPNTIHQFSYTLANSGTVDYQNYTGDRISAWTESLYAPVDYVHFDGQSWIGTGVDQTGNSLTVNADFQYDSTAFSRSNQFSILFGSRISGGNALLFNVNNQITTFRFQYGQNAPVSSVSLGNTTTSGTNRCQLKVNITALASKVVSLTGCGGTASGNVNSVAAPNTSLGMYIGGLNDGGSFVGDSGFVGNLFSFSVNNPNSRTGVTQRDYIPVKNLKTGKCGLYDKISQQFFANQGTGTITCPNPTATASSAKVLLYPASVPDGTINAELAAIQSGSATTAPNAIANINGSACSDLFYGTNPAMTSCETGVLPGTLGDEYPVGVAKTYDFKFVVFASSTAQLTGAKVNFGLSSGAKGTTAINWKQQVHPYIGVHLPVGSTPTIVSAGKNEQPFLNQIANNSTAIDAYLKALAMANDAEDGNLTSQIQIVDRGGFDPSAVGTYNVKYSVADSNGNVATLTLSVQVWNFAKIVAGGSHALALGSNGSVWSWGLNNVGQLGIGSTTLQNKPVQITTLSNIVDIAASYDASYAVAADGTVRSWGGNTYGEGGTGTGTAPGGGVNGTTSTTPRVVTLPGLNSGEKAVKASANFYTAGVITNQGAVYSWGLADFGTAGQGYSITLGQTDYIYAPYRNPFLSDVSQLAFGYYGGLAATNGGGLYTWGTNNEGELGAGATGAIANCHTAAGSSSTMVTDYWDCQPRLLSSITDAALVSAGLRNMDVVTSSGQVYTFGRNDSYNLGIGSTNAGLVANAPTATGFANAATISSSYSATIACSTSGQVMIWGSNSVGAFGNGNSNDTFFYSPTAVSQFPNCKSVAMTQRAMAVGFQYVSSLVLSADGTTVYGLGENQSGHLGSGAVAAEVYVTTTWAFTPPVAP